MHNEHKQLKGHCPVPAECSNVDVHSVATEMHKSEPVDMNHSCHWFPSLNYVSYSMNAV